MRFPLPRKVFIMPPALVPFSTPESTLHSLLTDVVQARYPGAIVQAAEYDIAHDAFAVAVLHPSFPLGTVTALAERWDATVPTAEYQEPVPCATE